MWEFLDNPDSGGPEQDIFLSVERGRVRGAVLRFRQTFRCGVECVNAATTHDLIVDEAFRGRGLGALLLRAAVRDLSVCLGAGTGPLSARLHDVLRWRSLSIRWFWKPLRLFGLASGYVREKFLPRARRAASPHLAVSDLEGVRWVDGSLTVHVHRKPEPRWIDAIGPRNPSRDRR